MHPDDRPPDIHTFREALLSTSPVGLWPSFEGQRRIDQIAPINRILAVLAIVLLAISVLATAFSPPVASP